MSVKQEAATADACSREITTSARVITKHAMLIARSACARESLMLVAQRTLVVRSPALVRRMCVADFAHFVDRGFFFNKNVDPLAGSVLFLTGAEWRSLRAKITPIFSPNKLKGMLPLIENTAEEFVVRLRRLLSVSRAPAGARAKDVVELFDGTEFDSRAGPSHTATVDSEKLVGGYTADAIVPCAFGLKSNVMDNDDDPFAVALQAFYEMSPYNIFEKAYDLAFHAGLVLGGGHTNDRRYQRDDSVP
ncbi:Probable cytochrome P450 6a23 [Eumeta japonica]|uniref:unspecific monooxygenase n=1 Tax=Eumeta variegata TaxID=151549 RepID=A0A4C1Z5G3_EUMVA|nr:Probable cytochrome P450 6a23 [Eumeta japonica]